MMRRLMFCTLLVAAGALVVTPPEESQQLDGSDLPEQQVVPIPSYATLYPEFEDQEEPKTLEGQKDIPVNSTSTIMTNSHRGSGSNSGMKNHTYEGSAVWIKAAVGQSCSEACKKHAAKCIENTWPKDTVEFNWDVLNLEGGSLHCINKAGHWWGNPVVHSNGICYLADNAAARYSNRCDAHPSELTQGEDMTTHRICPCVGMMQQTTTPSSVESSTVWTTTALPNLVAETCETVYDEWTNCTRECDGGFQWRQGTENGTSCVLKWDGSAWQSRKWWEHKECNTHDCPSAAFVQLEEAVEDEVISTASSRGGAWQVGKKDAEKAQAALKEHSALIRGQKAGQAVKEASEPWRNGEEWQSQMAQEWREQREKKAEAAGRARSGLNGRILRKKRAQQRQEKKSAKQEVMELMQDAVMDVLHPGAADALFKWWKSRAGSGRNSNNLPEPETQEERVKLLKIQVQVLTELIEKNEWSELHQDAAKILLQKCVEERDYQQKMLALDDINAGKVTEHSDCKFGNETACSTHARLTAVVDAIKGDLQAFQQYEPGMKPKIAKAIANRKMAKACADANLMELPAWLRTVTKKVDTLRHFPKSEQKTMDMENLLTEVKCRIQYYTEDCESGDPEACKGKRFAENIDQYVTKIIRKESMPASETS